MKGAPFDGGTRVAAFASGAGVTANAGDVSSTWLGAMDIMPTLLELAGPVVDTEASDNRAFRGRSFVDVIQGDYADIHPADENRAFEFAGHRWVVRGDWKAVREAGSEVWQLFNQADDPAESTDVSQAAPEILAEMVEAWHSWADDVGLVQEARSQAAPTGSVDLMQENSED